VIFFSFIIQFQNTAQAMAEGADFHMQVIERALRGQAQSLTTFSVFTGSLWPFVSLPDFSIQGNNFLLQTKTEMLAWGPLVETDAKLRAWEAYSTYMMRNSGWFPRDEIESEMEKQLKRLQEQALDSSNSKDESGLYIPLWQISPWLYRDVVNHNVTEQFETSIAMLLKTKQPVWSRFIDMANSTNSNNDNNSTVEGSEEDLNATSSSDMEEDTPDAPPPSMMSLLFQPVFRALPTHDYVSYPATKNLTETQQEVVAVYIAAVQWDALLADIIPEGTPSVNVVLRNSFGETLTFQVENNNNNIDEKDNDDEEDEGSSATSFLIGQGDQHSKEYDASAVSKNISDGVLDRLQDMPGIPTAISRHPHSAEELAAAGYTVTNELLAKMGNDDPMSGAPSIEMTIYPTKIFEDSYTSNHPLVFTLVLAAMALFAIAIFFWYSRSVHIRQQQLMEKAQRTALVVKSLFPSNVRDRIMQEAEESAIKKQIKRLRAKEKRKSQQLEGSHSNVGSIFGAGDGGGGSIGGGVSVGSVGSRYSRRGSISSQIRRGSGPSRRTSGPSGLRTSEVTVARNNSLGFDNPYGSKPIADHFSSTTVLFADMVGFTAWSSVREPTQVFTLLETVYHAFDKVARKRGIFKVETVRTSAGL